MLYYIFLCIQVLYWDPLYRIRSDHGRLQVLSSCRVSLCFLTTSLFLSLSCHSLLLWSLLLSVIYCDLATDIFQLLFWSWTWSWIRGWVRVGGVMAHNHYTRSSKLPDPAAAFESATDPDISLLCSDAGAHISPRLNSYFSCYLALILPSCWSSW